MNLYDFVFYSLLAGNNVVYLRYLSSGDGTTSLTGTMNDAHSLSQLEQRVCILHLINLLCYIRVSNRSIKKCYHQTKV